MLSSTHRVAKSVGSLVPRLGSATAVSAHNLIARRFKSSDADEDSRPCKLPLNPQAKVERSGHGDSSVQWFLNTIEE
jgi:hypothetical protein